MNYDQALEYLQDIDTVPYCDTKFTDSINKAKDALQDCLDLGLTGADWLDEELNGATPTPGGSP